MINQRSNIFKAFGIIPVLMILGALPSCKKTGGGGGDPIDTPYVFACVPAAFASVATTYNDYFTRGDAVTDQWTGADASYSVPLGDGKILWAFGDTFLGKVKAPNATHKYRWRDLSGLVPNTFMIQNTNVTPNTFITVVGPGKASNGNYWPVAKTGNEYKGGTSHEWYWPSDGTVIGDKLYMFFTKFKVLSDGNYYTAGTDVFVFSAAALKGLTATMSTINSGMVNYYTMPAGQHDETHFGAAIMEDDKDNYIYIADKVDFTPYGKWHCSKVLKVDKKNFNGPRSYLTGYGPAPTYVPQWGGTFPGSAGKTGNMQQLKDGKLKDLLVMNEFSVIKTKNKYRLIMQQEGDSKHIYSYESPNAVGPWECETLIHTITEVDTEPVITYNGFLHPQIKNGDNQYLFGYNLNAKNFLDLFSRVDTYRPKFIWVTIPD
ncbi:MAG: hypothetical protein ABIN95_01950 [Mucilaginibacter sp.]